MRKFAPILLLIIFSVYSEGFRTNFCAGLSLAVGDGADGMRPGPSLSFEPNAKVNPYFGLGGHIDYSWLTMKEQGFMGVEFKGGTHLFDIGFVPKAYVNINDNSSMFFEVDPGLALEIAYVSVEGYGESESDSEAALRFAMTYGFGFLIKQFICGFKFKQFIGDYGSEKWINFYIGYSGS